MKLANAPEAGLAGGSERFFAETEDDITQEAPVEDLERTFTAARTAARSGETSGTASAADESGVRSRLEDAYGIDGDDAQLISDGELRAMREAPFEQCRVEDLTDEQVDYFVQKLTAGGEEAYRRVQQAAAEYGVWRDGLSDNERIREAAALAAARELAAGNLPALYRVLSSTMLKRHSQELAKSEAVAEAAVEGVKRLLTEQRTDELIGLDESTPFVKIAAANDQGIHEYVEGNLREAEAAAARVEAMSADKVAKWKRKLQREGRDEESQLLDWDRPMRSGGTDF
jgi:hypothetical protein